MTVKRVILIRPGETDWNRLGRWQGWVATPLNEHGRRQTQALAKFVRNIGMSALYSSDLRRAVETAELLAERLGFAPVYDARLRERNIGAWQGLTLEEMRDWYPDEYEQLLADVDEYRIPGGESRAEVRARMVSMFDAILKEDKGETVGILSHTTALRALLSELLPECDPNSIEVSNTSVTTLARTDAERWQLVAANDVMHLEGLASHSAKEVEQSK
jgi:broad specificity phosphatase PhoE